MGLSSPAHAIYYLLYNDATTKALVDSRIYHGFAPAGSAYPNIEITQLGEATTNVMGGERGPYETIMQIDINQDNISNASPYSSLISVSDAVVSKLRNYNGTITVAPNSFVVHWIYIDDIFDNVEYDSNIENTIYTRTIDVLMWHY